MARTPKAAGGFHSVAYTIKMARKSGNFREFYKVLRSKNTCKACALGMSGMVDEEGHIFQVCKKSMQAVAQDLLGGIPDEFFFDHTIEELGSMSGFELESAGRLTEPLMIKEGETNYTPVSWDDAYQFIISQLAAVDPKRAFVYMSGRSSNEAAFLGQLLARQNQIENVNNCSYYCHQASGVGLKQTIGSGTSTVTLEDVGKSDLVVLIGANPSSNHPRFISHLIDVRKRGGKVVVINPFKEVGLEKFRIPSRPLSLINLAGTTVSDLYLQPHCGGDMAFLKAVAVSIVSRSAYNKEFLEKYCNYWNELKTDLEKENIDELLTKSGITLNELNEFADILLSYSRVIFSWAMGVTHQLHGVETVRMIANIQLMLGNIGKEGAGLLPLRGHSNVQGVGSVGVVPKLSTEIVDLIGKHLNIQIPNGNGKDTFSCMQAANREEIDLAIMLGGNLYGANPSSEWAKSALHKIKSSIFISTTLNLGHIHGRGKTSLIIPVRTREEEKQTTTQESMFNYVRMSVGGFDAPVPALPTEVELFTLVGKKLFGTDPINWEELQYHKNIRDVISKTIPYLSPISGIKNTKSFTIPGRIKHTPKFATENGKANLFVGLAPDARPVSGCFNLLTFRSENQFNTIIYGEDDPYRGVSHRNVIFMNSVDIETLGITSGELVKVSSEVGVIMLEVMDAPIRKGNVAVFYPEGNVIVPPKTDPQSKTPSFKRVTVQIEKL